MGPRRSPTRLAIPIFVLLVASAPVAVAQSVPLGDEPALLRSDQEARMTVHGGQGMLLLHAGVERSAAVTVYAAGEPNPQSGPFRSRPSWTLHPFSLAAQQEEARIVTDGGVWAVAFTGEISEADRLVATCDDVGRSVLWQVDAAELQVVRDAVTAPRVEIFSPRTSGLVPDERAVQNHTMLLDDGQTPIYLHITMGEGECAGTLFLDAKGETAAPLLGEPWRGILQAMVLLAGATLLVLVSLWLVGKQRDRRRKAMAGSGFLYRRRLPPTPEPAVMHGSRHVRRASVLFMVLMLLILSVPLTATAQYGVHTLDADGEIALPAGGGGTWVCVHDEREATRVVLVEEDGRGAAVQRAFDPREGPDCQALGTGTLRSGEGEDEAFAVLVLGREPREASAPGVVRLARPGTALLIPHPSGAGEVGVLGEAPGQEVELVRVADLARIGSATGPGETRFTPEQQEDWTGGVLVAFVDGPETGSVRVSWEDPDWFRRAPTIGHVAMVVVLALLVILYLGRSPRNVG